MVTATPTLENKNDKLKQTDIYILPPVFLYDTDRCKLRLNSNYRSCRKCHLNENGGSICTCGIFFSKIKKVCSWGSATAHRLSFYNIEQRTYLVLEISVFCTFCMRLCHESSFLTAAFCTESTHAVHNLGAHHVILHPVYACT